MIKINNIINFPVKEIYKKAIRILRESKLTRSISIAFMALPLIMPVGVVTYTGNSITEDTPSLVMPKLTGLTSDIVSVKHNDINLAIVKKPEPIPKPVIVIRNGNYLPEPDEAAKRLLVKTAAAAYGIDWKILEAVWQIESGKSWYRTVRSYAGAAGPCQFMPGTWRGYAVDGNGDGIKDINYAPDCLFGSAKLLAANGAAAGDNVRALFAYNRSTIYVNKVLLIANSY